MQRMEEIAGGLRESVRRFIHEEDGVGVVEVILILVILVGLVLLFKDEISGIVEDALSSISDDASLINN